MPAQPPEPMATIWLAEVPAHLFWDARRWRVLDMPRQVMVMPESAFSLTHLPTPKPGWHFQAQADEDGELATFEVLSDAEDGWTVVNVYR